ncbi:MAG TPA: hypothetical protein VJ820_15285 [Propionibacteriaceae bacterium]|nr:hypothetical protein [Propionibacteriaceae bacterium]
MSQSSRTPLASGTINGNTPLRVELIEPNRGKPPVIAIDWPPTPTVFEPAQLDVVVAAAMRILANSVVTLAAIRIQRKI